MKAEDLFWELAAELQDEDPRVVEGTFMNGRCFRVGKAFLAIVDRKGSGLVVKLPKSHVAEIIDQGEGQPFAPAGKVFKEWLSADARSAASEGAACRGGLRCQVNSVDRWLIHGIRGSWLQRQKRFFGGQLLGGLDGDVTVWLLLRPNFEVWRPFSPLKYEARRANRGSLLNGSHVRDSEHMGRYAPLVKTKRLGKDIQERLRAIVRELVQEYGGQKAAAAALGVSQGYLSEFINGGRGGGSKLLGGLATEHPHRLAEVLNFQHESLPVSSRERAIVLMAADGRGSVAELREAARQASAVLGDDDDLSELRWVERITPFVRASRGRSGR